MFSQQSFPQAPPPGQALPATHIAIQRVGSTPSSSHSARHAAGAPVPPGVVPRSCSEEVEDPLPSGRARRQRHMGKAHVAQELLDDGWVLDDGEHLHAAAALAAGEHVELEDSLEERSPIDAGGAVSR